MKNRETAEDRRKLTPDEARRTAVAEQIKAEYARKGYRIRERTVGAVRANVLALVLWIPFLLLFLWLYNALGPDGSSFSLDPREGAIVLAVWLLSVPVHEFIHGLFWALCAEGGFRSVSFGFIAKYLTPYCSCSEPLSRSAYILGGAMPGVLLGLLPCAWAVVSHAPGLLYFGLLQILGAGGDLQAVLLILFDRRRGKNAVYLDHPTKMGFYIMEIPQGETNAA